jgi:predicted nuclease of predicted toxin-antitoxin system
LRLLFDQNLSRKLLPHLNTMYPGSAHVLPLGLAKSPDSDLWYYARHHGLTLVTKNTDLVDLCVLRGAPPKVLWLRIGNCTTQLVLDVIRDNEERIARFGREPSIIVRHCSV